MAYADGIRTDTCSMNDVATLLEGVCTSSYPSNEASYTPTVTCSAGSATGANWSTKFARIGKIGILVVGGLITKDATPAATISLSLPSGWTASVGGPIIGRDADEEFIVKASVNGSVIDLKRADGANWAASAGHWLSVQGIVFLS